MHAIEFPTANDFSRTLLPSKIPASMIVVASWRVSRARLELVRLSSFAFRRESVPRTFHCTVRFTRSSNPRRKAEKKGRARERGEKRGTRGEIGNACVRSCVITFGEHVGADREQVDTFREEIARRTDTSRARSSYPQHPAVAVTAAEGDEAEHARNSALPPSPPPTPYPGLPSWASCSHPQPPIRRLLSRPHPPRLSSPRSTSAASTPHSLFRAEFTPSFTESHLFVLII